jgi:hypothetical protein
MEMNYPFQECMAARDLAHRAGKHLRQQFFPKMPYKEAKSLFEARAILIDAQKAALDEAQRIMMSGNGKE